MHNFEKWLSLIEEIKRSIQIGKKKKKKNIQYKANHVHESDKSLREMKEQFDDDDNKKGFPESNDESK